MVLILAVEPDARQLANLATVLRSRPKTELVIAGGAAAALEHLGGRVPDVLLTSALLSRQDETVLASWLRNLGPAASHVQELTIPLLATSAPPPQKRRGVLATLRRAAAKPATPDGCDPDAFAEQVSGYMDRASAARPAPTPVEVAPTAVEVAPTSVGASGAAAIAPTSEVERGANVELLLLPVGLLPEASLPADEPEQVLAPDTEDLLPLVCEVRFAPEPTLELLLLPVWVIEGGPEGPPLLDQHLEIESSRPHACEGSPQHIGELPADTEDLLPLVCAYEPQAQAMESLAAAQPVVADDAELWVPILIDDEREDPRPIVPDDVWVLGPVIAIDDLLEGSTIRITGSVGVPEPAIVAAPAEPPTPSSRRGGPSGPPAPKRKAATPKPKPAQDEWGFFDPDQCGFAALLAKLDEITEENDAEEDEQNADTTVRLLSY